MGPTKGSKRTFIVKAKGKPLTLKRFSRMETAAQVSGNTGKATPSSLRAMPAMVCSTSEKAVARSP